MLMESLTILDSTGDKGRHSRHLGKHFLPSIGKYVKVLFIGCVLMPKVCNPEVYILTA